MSESHEVKVGSLPGETGPVQNENVRTVSRAPVEAWYRKRLVPER